MAAKLYEIRKQSKIELDSDTGTVLPSGFVTKPDGRTVPVSESPYLFSLFRFYSTNRACACTCAAAYALVGIDLELAVSHADSANRALSFTCSAADACIIDNICHNNILL